MESHKTIDNEVKELDQLLESNFDEKIWSQRINSTRLLLNTAVHFVIAAASVYFFRDIFNVTIALLLILPYLIAIYFSTTMEYSILPLGINFKSGFFGKNIFIPFDDITAINLVKYDHQKYSTIHFGTHSEYKIKRISFIDGATRPHITFENILDGDKVYELLQILWKRKTTNFRLKDLMPIKQKVILKNENDTNRN